ncbi:1592_t:CDS:2, partial [Racocetra fulgida]
MTDPAWNEFKKYPPTTPKGHPGAECIYCNHKLSGQAQRLRAHLNSCQKYLTFLNLNQNESTIFNSLSVTIAHKKLNLPIDPFLSRQLNLIEQKTIDKKIARAFYACGIPHTLIENKFFIAALKSLRPTYNLPSRYLLGNNLLTNLIVSDIFKKSNFTDDELQWAHNTLEIASKIANYFNSHQVLKAHLRETQKQEINKTIALVNPVKTRWGTQLAVLEKLLESKSSIQQDRQIRILIANEDKWDNILVLAEVLHPIVKSTLSLVYKEMNDLKNLECNIAIWSSDVEQEVDDEETNYLSSGEEINDFWDDFDELANLVYDSEI